MKTSILEKTQDISTIYFEENLIGTRLLDLRDELNRVINASGQFDYNNITSSCNYIMAIYTESFVHAMKK